MSTPKSAASTEAAYVTLTASPSAEDDGWGIVVTKKKKKKKTSRKFEKKAAAPAAGAGAAPKVSAAEAKKRIDAAREAALAATLVQLAGDTAVYVEKKAKGAKHHQNAMRR